MHISLYSCAQLFTCLGPEPSNICAFPKSLSKNHYNRSSFNSLDIPTSHQPTVLIRSWVSGLKIPEENTIEGNYPRNKSENYLMQDSVLVLLPRPQSTVRMHLKTSGKATLRSLLSIVINSGNVGYRKGMTFSLVDGVKIKRVHTKGMSWVKRGWIG